MDKAQLRSVLQPMERKRVAWADGWPVVIGIPVRVVATPMSQESAVRFKQGTLYDVRPKPGHDGGTPLTVTARKQIEYKGVRVFKPSRSESDDALDLAAARWGYTML